jgi:DNA-binding transcriptional MerR regulator
MIKDLTIDDLEKHSGLSIRTLHYYMQKGLLPSPDKRGKYASYSQEHLDRLDLILILKEMHLPLNEIRELLDSLTPEEIQHYRDDQEDFLVKLKTAKPDAQDSNSVSESSALDYIKGLEKAQNQFYQLR